MRQLYLAVAVCAAALPAYAQGQPQGATPQAEQQQQASPMTQQFLSKAAIGDHYEIQSSRMAMEKSLGGEFQNFARRIIDDHTKSGEKLKTLAKNMNLQLPSELDAKHSSMIEQLSSASGSQFASMYRDQQIDAHKEAIQLYQQYSQQGDNAELRQFVDSTIPALQEHLQLAQNLPQEPGTAVSQAPGMQMGQKMGRHTAQGETKIIGSLGPDHVFASDLEDMDIYSTAGEQIGEVSDVVLNRNGETVALVVGVGGFLGLGEKNVAIPFTAVEISASRRDESATTEPGSPNRIVLRGMTREELEAAPSFEKD